MADRISELELRIAAAKTALKEMDPEGKHGYEIVSRNLTYKEEHNSKQYTMDNVVIVFDGKIWDFKDVTLLDITRDRLRECAKKMYNVFTSSNIYVNRPTSRSISPPT
ncbi:hypothetical protein VE04_02282 [Pseudogymnoascus sp. 24MN13]|nr:hypothetical protein VE04_02282 [Pseudogymnoascus sp. 24MN13]